MVQTYEDGIKKISDIYSVVSCIVDSKIHHST